VGTMYATSDTEALLKMMASSDPGAAPALLSVALSGLGCEVVHGARVSMQEPVPQLTSVQLEQLVCVCAQAWVPPSRLSFSLCCVATVAMLLATVAKLLHCRANVVVGRFLHVWQRLCV